MPRKTTRRIADLKVDVWEPDGPARGVLVLLHGLWVGGWVWEDFAAYLAGAGYASHVPTFRGHDDSAPVADVGNISMFDYVEDALTVVRSAEAAAVIGHSGGGLVAQKVAEAEKRLRALVLLNAAPPGGIMVRQSRMVVRSLLKYLGSLLGARPVLPEEADYRMLFLPGVRDEVASAFYGRIGPDSGRALREIVLGRVRVDAGRVRCPVLVAAAGDDPSLGPPVQRKIARKYRADYREYLHLGHTWLVQEGWREVAGEVEMWLGEHVPARVG